MNDSFANILKSGNRGVMETASGRLLNILEPEVSIITIGDIAHALSNQCRYGGHCSKFYSVAEHSIKVMRFVERYTSDADIILGALLHDASEAYLVDIPTPIKGELANYKHIEANLMNAIFKRFSVQLFFEELPDIITVGDRYILLQEAKKLVKSKGLDWPVSSNEKIITLPIYRNDRPRCWSPVKARRIFLREFRRVMKAPTRLDRLLLHLHLFWI